MSTIIQKSGHMMIIVIGTLVMDVMKMKIMLNMNSKKLKRDLFVKFADMLSYDLLLNKIQ